MTTDPKSQPEINTADPALASRELDSPPSPPKAGGLLIFAYVFAQFGNWLALLTPVVITIALRVADVAAAGGLTDAEKATQLGYVMGVGALASTLATPIWGAISDRTTARIGRRKPWMIVGVIGGAVGLTLMAWGPNMLVLGVGWVIAQLSFNANQAALNALLPDAIAESQRGRVSGLLGLTTSIAILAGTFITQFTTGNYFLMFLLPLVVSALALILLLAVFRDRPAVKGALPPFTVAQFFLSFWVNPVKHPDYGWAFLSRFLVFLANAFVTTYGVYFLTDHIGVGPAEIATFIFFSTFINTAITIVISVVGGWLSDRFRRRKPFVWGAAVILAAGLVVTGFAGTFEMYLVGAAIVALGSGLYYAVDLALVAAVLPDQQNSAKYMGVFQIANSLPQSLAPVIAPALLAIGAAGGAGNYPAVFIAGGVFALLGAFAIVPIRKSH